MAAKRNRKGTRTKIVKNIQVGEGGPKTGAPPLRFESLQIQGIVGARLLRESTRAARAALRSLPTSEVKQRVWLGLIELVERVSWPRMTNNQLENAADDLAGMAIAAASFLADLADSDLIDESLQVRLAAMRKNYWPVLLRVGKKRNRKGEHLSTLESAKEAKAYLLKICLGVDAAKTFRFIRAGENPFSRAAELLIAQLLRWREVGAWRGEPTPWAKDLLSLDFPITIENRESWWHVAKSWLDEQWDRDPEQFKPLIAACKNKGKSLASPHHELYQSEVRSRVIDLRIKEAFFAFARSLDS